MASKIGPGAAAEWGVGRSRRMKALEAYPDFLTGDINFEVESPVDSGIYVQEISFVIRGNKPVADQEIDEY